jgi:hypothetical protein
MLGTRDSSSNSELCSLFPCSSCQLEPKTDEPCRQDPELAAKDFRDRIKNYEKVYQTIDESEKHLTYVKITNIGYKILQSMLPRKTLTRAAVIKL